MIKLVAPYSVPGIENASLLEVTGFIRNNKVLTIDTETVSKGRSPRKVDPHDMEIVSFQIGNHLDQYVIDVRHSDLWFLASCLEDKLIVGHNLKFDYSVIQTNCGVRIQNLFDTMIASQLLTAGLETLKHSLYDVSKRYLNRRPDKEPEMFMPLVSKNVRMTYSDQPFTLEQITYGALDVELAHMLYLKLHKLLEEDSLLGLAEEVEFPFVKVAAECELNGMPFNASKWTNLIDSAESKCEYLLVQLGEYAHINWNSPKQVGAAFKGHGIDISYVDKDTREVKESVSKLKLAPKAPDHPILKLYLEYKGYQKLESSYGANFLANLSPITGRIHSDVLQLKVTGRTGSANVNLQQIPKDNAYRNCFETDQYLVSGDYSTQEICMVAHLSREPAMCRALSEGVDIHTWMASQIFEEEITPSLRQKAKTITFALLYGAGPSKIAENLKISVREAKAIVAKYFKAFPALKEYLTKVQERSLADGYHTIGEGSLIRKVKIPNYDRYTTLKRYIEDCASKNREPLRRLENEFSAIEAKIRRDANNYPIQGHCATMSKLAGVYLYEKLKESKFKNYKILLLIHDEYLLESSYEDTSEILRSCMREAAQRTCSTVEIKVVPQISRCWQK